MRFLVALILLIFTTLSYGHETYCPQVKFNGKKIDFSKTEIQLFCGDPKSHAWKKIPAYEAEVVIRGFLQSRGYLSPRFEVKDEVLHVTKGRKSIVKKVKVISHDENLAKKIKREIRRLYQGRELTTSMLNSIEAEVIAQIRRKGRPCGKASSEVDVNTDTVTILLDPKEKHVFGKIKTEEIKGLHETALERFYPMNEHQRFDGDLLTLTERRMLRAQVVSGTYFLESCADDGKEFSLEQRFIPGPPRTLRFGAGASTEMGPIARARWSNNRWGPMASLLSASAEASFREQLLNMVVDYYAWKSNPRQSITGLAELSRDSQFEFEQLQTRARTQMKWTTDIHENGIIGILGPGYDYGTFASASKTNTQSFSTGVIEGSLQRMSHDYEIYDIHPQEGEQERLTLYYVNPTLGFKQSLTRVDTSIVRLARLMNSGRGAIIGGARLKAGTSFVRANTDPGGLPPDMKFFGGGSDDIRGYLLNTLPKNGGAGALTRLVGKFEARRTHFFLESLEGFTFLDAGYFSERSFAIDRRMFYSPGVGMRWLSPIGVVETYWARAFASNPYQDNGNFFFAGIGGNF
ncbi:MAG: autotransporter assembly complex protein TamA [Bacteriovoracaceae bacterium]